MILLRAKQVITSAMAPPLRDAGVLVDAGKILDVGDAAALALRIGPGTREIDLGDQCVLPGLFDSHVHLGFDGGPDPVARMQASSDHQQLVQMLKSASELLRAGVTTARDLGARGHLALVVQEAVATGMALGPELLVANQPVTTTGGHCWFMGGESDTREDVRRAVRERHKAGANLVKVMSTGGFMTKGSAPWHAQFALDELRTIVEEAHRVDMPVAAHAHGTPGIANAVEAGVSTLEHCSWVDDVGMPGAAYAPEITDKIVARDIRVCPTVNLRFHDVEPARREGRMRRIKEMHAAGVRFIAGTDAGIDFTPHGAYAKGLVALSSCGFSSAEVIACATSEAAAGLGVGDRKGTIAPGMDADLIAVPGDPLEDLGVLERVRFVMLAGRVVEFPELDDAGA